MSGNRNKIHSTIIDSRSSRKFRWLVGLVFLLRGSLIQMSFCFLSSLESFMRNHVWAVVSLCILVTLTLVYAGPSKPASQPTVSSTATPMLKVAGMWSLDSGRSSRFDPSGLVWWPATQSFLTVNDKPDEVHVYKIGSPASQPSRNKDGQHVRSLSLLLKSNAV